MQRFWSKVDKSPGHGPEGECWPWIGGLRSKKGGYGCLKFEGKLVDAHRLSFKLFTKMNIPRTVLVCHDCDFRLCVNPAHLFAGRDIDNVHDMDSKGRRVSHREARVCPQGTWWCCDCKRFIAIIGFAKNRSTYNGLDSSCKECKNKRNKKRIRRKNLVIS